MPEAKFSVGHRIMRSIRYGNEVEVFYPIAKGTCGEAPEWLPHGRKSLKGLLNLSFRSEYISNFTFLLDRFLKVRLDAVRTG